MRAWLDGLRAGDLAKLHAASALPFTLENRTEGQTTCSGTATSTADSSRLLSCLIEAEPMLRHQLAFPEETVKRLEVAERMEDHVTVIVHVYDDARGAINYDLRVTVRPSPTGKRVSAVVLQGSPEIE